MGVVLAAFASPLSGEDRVRGFLERFRRELAGLYEEEVSTGSPVLMEADAILALVLTGGVEGAVLELAKAGKPVIILAHQGFNSLAAGLEAASALRRRVPTWLIPADSPDYRGRVERILRGVRAACAIRGMRIGVLGDPSPWLVYSVMDERALVERLGVAAVRIGLDEFLSLCDSGPPSSSMAEGPGWAGGGSIEVDDVSRAVYALKSIMRGYGLSGLTMNCFEIIKVKGVAPCLAASILQDEGFTIGCEGDVPALIAMLVVKLISGSPSFIGNMVRVDGDLVTLAHCTMPLSLAERYCVTTHFETGAKGAVEGEFRAGVRATILRFSPDYGVLRAGVGLTVAGSRIGDGCRSQVTLKFDHEVEEILEDPMGNHHVLAIGDLVEELRAFCRCVGARFEEL